MRRLEEIRVIRKLGQPRSEASSMAKPYLPFTARRGHLDGTRVDFSFGDALTTEAAGTPSDLDLVTAHFLTTSSLSSTSELSQ